MPHESGHAADVGAADQGVSGEGVAKIIRSDTPANAGARQGRVPSAANAPNRPSSPGYDVPNARRRVPVMPDVQKREKRGADGNIAAVLQSIFLRVWHPDHGMGQIHISPLQSEKFTGADTRAGAQAKNDDALHMRRCRP